MNRWPSADQRYDQPQGLTGYARQPAFKWIGLLVAWVIVSGLLSITHLGVLLLVFTAGLICYCVYSILRDTPPAGQQTADQWASEQFNDWDDRQHANDWDDRQHANDWRDRQHANDRHDRQANDRHDRQHANNWHDRQQFNAPPGWPEPPLGWEPPPGWKPDRSWPPAPPGWQFWVRPDEVAGGQRMGRSRHIGRSYRGGI